MTDAPGSLGGRMAKGAAWMVAVRMLDRLIGLVSTIVLARLLVPEDFGIVALATTIIAILEIWSEFGFDLALIRDQTASRKHYDTAWTLTVLRGTIVALLIALFAGYLAIFFEDPRIEIVLYFLAAMALMEGFVSIRVVDFRKQLNLHREFIFLMSARAAQFCATIALAFIWRDYWALVAGILVSRFVKLVLSYIMAPHRPRFTLSAFSDLFGFSKWIVANSVLNFITTRLDTLVVGRMSGVSSVGVYSMAYEVSNMATTELVWPISRAIFPGFARIADDPEELARTYNRSLSVIVLIALPVTAGIALTAEYFVPVMLGAKWMAAIPLMQVLALYGGLRVLIANTGSLYLAINRPYLISVMGAANLVVLAPLMIYLVGLYGPLGAAWAVVAGIVPMLVLMFVFNRSFVQIRLLETLSYLVRPLVACAVMIGALLSVQTFMPPSDDFFVLVGQLVFLSVSGAMIYCLSIAALWWHFRPADAVEPLVFDLIRRKVFRSRAGQK